MLALAPVADLGLGEALGLDTDAVAAFLGEEAAARPELDPAQLPAPACPTRLLHGDGDAIVPVAVSESYCRRHPSAVLTRVAAGHFALIDPRGGVWPTLLGELAILGRLD